MVSSEFGDPTKGAPIGRLSAIVAQATVFRNTGVKSHGFTIEVKMPVPPDKPVYFADEEMIRLAIGMDTMPEDAIPIPCGLILQSNGITVPVHFDSRYILGPEGAHINVSGISGLATKTSYIMFLIQSIFQLMPDQATAIIFNVKYSDLLHIHEEPEDLTDRDIKFYEELEVEPRPFDKNIVHYYLPRGREGRPNSEMPPEEYQLYAYELADVYDRLDLLFAEVPDPYHTLDAFITAVRNNWNTNTRRLEIQLRESGQRRLQVQARELTASTWNELLEMNPYMMTRGFGIQESTARRILRELNRLTSSEIFVNRRGNNEVYLGQIIRNIQPGHIYVIDIYKIHPRNWPFIVGDVLRTIDELYTDPNVSPPKYLIIYIDELNTLAPSNGGIIADQIAEVARKGRSRGTILFTAQQFKSEVYDQVIGNCSVHAVGRTGSTELRKAAYGFLDENVKKNALMLSKGEMILSFPTWRAPIKVIFPKPAYRRVEYQRIRGRAG